MKKMALIAVAAGMLAVPAYAQLPFQFPVAAMDVGEDLALVYFFGRMDTNKDGTVSPQEYNALFAAADADANGSVTLPEMRQQKEREKVIMQRALTGKK
jgi:hypothetical protein